VNEHVSGSKRRNAFGAFSGRDKKLVGIETNTVPIAVSHARKARLGKPRKTSRFHRPRSEKKFRAPDARKPARKQR